MCQRWNLDPRPLTFRDEYTSHTGSHPDCSSALFTLLFFSLSHQSYVDEVTRDKRYFIFNKYDFD